MQAKLDGLGKSGWLALTLVAFWAAWSLGLATLAYLAGSGRLRAWRSEMPGHWFNLRAAAGPGWQGWGAGSGNQAFDEYRLETLRRLEEEQREFQAYLERLRRARDKAEFDQFMAERRRRSGPLQDTGADPSGSARAA